MSQVNLPDGEYAANLTIWASLDSLAVADYTKRFSIKIPKIAQFLIRYFGVLYEDSLQGKITEGRLKKDFWEKRAMILETYQNLLKKTFPQYVAGLCQNISSYSGFTQEDVRKQCLNTIRYLPMPFEQLNFVFLQGQAPFGKEFLDPLLEKTNCFVARLLEDMAMPKGDEKKNEPDQVKDIKYHQFLISQAGLVHRSVYFSWIQLVFQWHVYAPQASLQADLLLRQISGQGFLTLSKYPYDQQRVSNLSFRNYLIDRTLRVLEEHAGVRFSKRCCETLAKIFLSSDLARTTASFFTSLQSFEDSQKVPGEGVIRFFLKTLVDFRKLRKKKPDALSDQDWEQMFEWMLCCQKPCELDLPMENLEPLFKIACRIGDFAEIEPERRFGLLSSLGKFKNSEGFAVFLEAVAQAGIPVADKKFVFLAMTRAAKMENFAPFLELFKAVAAALNQYKVAKPPGASFWADLFHLPPETAPLVGELVQVFAAKEELSEELYLLIPNFLKKKIIAFDFKLLESLPEILKTKIQMTPGEICSILAHVYNKVEHPVQEKALRVVADTLAYLASKYPLSNYQIGKLFFEMLSIPPELAAGQLPLIAAIEDFIGFPLHASDIYNWAMYHPDLEETGQILESIFSFRKEIESQYLDHFTLPSSALSFYHQNAPRLIFLQSAGLKPQGIVHTEFQQTVSSIGTLLMFAALSNTIQPLSDFIHKDAMLDKPVVCGEESRTVVHAKTISPLNPKYSQETALWRGWEIPEDSKAYPVFVVHIVNLSTLRTYTIRAAMPLQWQDFLDDESLMGILHQAAKILGEESHEKVNDLPQEQTLEAYLPLFPRFAEIWGGYQPKTLDRQAVGQALFAFVKKMKTEFRKGLIEMATKDLPSPLAMQRQKDAGHIYPIGKKAISLVPSNLPMTPMTKEKMVLGPEFDDLCTNLQRAISETSEKQYQAFTASLNDQAKDLFGCALDGLCQGLFKALSEVCGPIEGKFAVDLENAIRGGIGLSYEHWIKKVMREVTYWTNREDDPFREVTERAICEVIRNPANLQTFAERMQKLLSGSDETFFWTANLPMEHLKGELKVSLRVLLQTKEKNSALNEVTFSYGNIDYTVRWTRYLASKNFAKMLKWHILLLINKVYRNG